MNRKRRAIYLGLVILGIALLIAGGMLLKGNLLDGRNLIALPYVMIGLGCGLFGHGMGSLVNDRIMKAHPDVAKQKDIEENDERNVMIASRAKAKAFDSMEFIFGALLLSFALMNVELAVILLLVAAYLFVIGIGVYYRFRYEKEL